MAAQDCFSIGRDISPQPSTAASSGTGSPPAAPTAPRRIYLRTSALHAEHLPSHCAISFSSWTRYSTLPMISPSGQLKASMLCKASGTSPTYDPPVSEWAYLGADQPSNMSTEPEVREKWSDWRKRKCPGGSPLATSAQAESGVEWKFCKQPIKRTSTESQLTSGLTMGFCGGAVTTAKKYGLQGLTCEDLPSAFDSDDDED